MTPHEKALMDVIKRRSESNCGGTPVIKSYTQFYTDRLRIYKRTLTPRAAHLKALTDMVWKVGDHDMCSGTPVMPVFIKFYDERLSHYSKEYVT